MTDQETAQKFASILQDTLLEIDPTIHFSWRRMFGGAGYYANGSMFAAWFRGADLALKLPEQAREALLRIEDSQEVNNQYVAVPPTFLTDLTILVEWVAKSISYVKTQPAPVKKKKR